MRTSYTRSENETCFFGSTTRACIARVGPKWCERLLERRPELIASVKSQRTTMLEKFPESLVEGYQPLTTILNLPDANDRHVLAAAIRCGAQHIVTENLKDFPNGYLEQFGVEPISADEFLSRTA